MAKRIIEKVREKRASMEQDPNEAETNAKLAAAAIKGGISSTAWNEYMSQFVEDSTTPLGEDQLKRLLATDGTDGNEELDRKRAYMLSNGICGGASTGDGIAPGGGAVAAKVGGGAANPVAVAAPEPVGLPFDFFVNSIDQELDLDCLPE